MRNFIFLSLLLIIALASCAPSSTGTRMATTPASPTKKPTSTITPTLKPSATILPTAIEKPSPTATYIPAVFNSKDSPNGEYMAIAYDYYWNSQQAIEIQDKEGKLIWQIPSQGELPQGDPHPYMGIYYWSNDSSQLYFCYYWFPDGGEIKVQWTGYGLQKIDIKTGNIQPVLPGGGYMTFAISPDESQIAYVRKQDQPRIIYVRNLSTGAEKTAYIIIPSENYVTLGNIEWSPNSKGLVFETQDDNLMSQTIYLNLSTMKQKIIKEYPVLDFSGWAVLQGWVDNNTLEFAESGDNGVQIIHIDVEKKETVVIGTATPNK